MANSQPPSEWIWHPSWSEEASDTVGAFVHFRTHITLDASPSDPLILHITADTRYKLYVNSHLTCYGPVKGDDDLWFYDQVDIQPLLKIGLNKIVVRVLRLFHATGFATSFPRLVSPGLCVRFPEEFDPMVTSMSAWETALDTTTRLPADMAEDDFLHIYEHVDNAVASPLDWVPAKPLQFSASHGLSPPWRLSPRMIPFPRSEPAFFEAIHNVQSSLPREDWERALLVARENIEPTNIILAAGTTHRLEIEADQYLTAFVKFRFERPREAGSTVKVTYSECYENNPIQIPYLRSKGDRCDIKRSLFGPQDVYILGGDSCISKAAQLTYDDGTEEDETFAPFHYRTFRFLTLEIKVGSDSDLTLKGIEISRTTYPLDVKANVHVTPNREPKSDYHQIWDTSVRTLENCMHDCYEDCPFYEQLQYSMDTRSSILFTYSVSGDDRLARQAITQLHNSYRPNIGLTASRAPSHQRQTIPHFSLFWVMMVADHYEYFGDASFVRQFLPACDGVLEHFAQRVDKVTGLVAPSPVVKQCWDFVDWTDTWRPMGIPPAVAHTGYCTFTSMLYACTLKSMTKLLLNMGRPALANEYDERAKTLVQAIQRHCYDGQFFTDGLASKASPSEHYSQHSQIWAVLCGAAEEEKGRFILKEALRTTTLGKEAIVVKAPTGASDPIRFAPASTAMSFYTLRAMSVVGGSLYDDQFHDFWTPWRGQLSLNLLTWEEDSVSQRSDCHAWGCAALYEFTREVAGISPGSAGWSVITFRPRLSLFPYVDIQVPFGGAEASPTASGFGSGIAHVRWSTQADDVIRCSLVLRGDGNGTDSEAAIPPVRLTLPGCDEETVHDSAVEIVRLVRLAKVS